MQGTVDPVPDADTCVLRLDVDVGGAVAHALRDDEVHDLDDGGVDTGVGFRHRPRRDRLGREERVDVTTHASQRSVRLVDRPPDVRRRGDHRHDGQPRRSAHLVDGRGILGERHRDLQAFVGPSHRDGDVGARHRFGNQGDRVVLRRALSQVGERQVEPGRQSTREVEVIDRPQFDKQLAETLAGGGLLQQRFVELGRGDQLALDQELAEPRDPGCVWHRDGRCGRGGGDGPTNPLRVAGFG